MAGSEGYIKAHMARPESRQSKRWQLVTTWKRLGDYTAVAKECKARLRDVRLWVGRWLATCDVQDAQRIGRPSLVTTNDGVVQRVLRQGVTQGNTAKESMHMLHTELGISCSVRTLQRSLHQIAHPMRPVKTVILKEADKAVRLKFAKQWVRRSWKNVMVTDSKYFDLIPQPGKSVGAKVWVLYGHQPPEVPVSKTSFRLHVYGGVSKYGRTPLFAVTCTTGIKKPDQRGGSSRIRPTTTVRLASCNRANHEISAWQPVGVAAGWGASTQSQVDTELPCKSTFLHHGLASTLS